VVSRGYQKKHRSLAFFKRWQLTQKISADLDEARHQTPIKASITNALARLMRKHPR